MTSTRQAVVLIHGIGEQRPMDTLRGFVNAVWTTHTEIHDPHSTRHAHALVWSKPDTVSASFELRRLTTPQNKGGARTDFIEFYWAHMMEGTSYGHIVAWMRTLLLRRPSAVPPQLTLAYWLLWLVVIVASALAIYLVASSTGGDQSAVRRVLSLLVSVVLLPIVGFVARSIVGDAARYLHVAPTNVQRRHEIRKAGVALLDALHQRGYDRIVVVGHSLGSVIGYDILTHAWAASHAKPPTSASPSIAALDRLEATARAIEHGASPSALTTYRTRQHAYLNELVDNGNPWRVTDFITLGSPLAHASILLARDLEQLRVRQVDREFPTCPPALETMTRNGEDIQRFSFEQDRRKPDGYRFPHHAALFGPTRWSNLYFPNSLIINGDLIGGPLSGMFGSGIQDTPVVTTLRGGLLSHTLYWKSGKGGSVPPHLDALRQVLNLANEYPEASEQECSSTASATGPRTAAANAGDGTLI